MNSRATLAALQDVAEAAGRMRDGASLAAFVSERARVVAGGDAAVLRWFDPTTGSFRLLAALGTPQSPDVEIATETPTAISDAFSTGRPVIVNDYRQSGLTTRWGRSHHVHSQVAVPLIVDSRPVGTLAVLSFATHTYTESDCVSLSVMAAIVAPALQALRLAAEVNRTKDMVAKVYDALGATVIVYDRHGRPVHYNSASQEAFGNALADPSGARDHSYPMFHEDGRPVAPEERPFSRVLATRSAVRGVIAGFDVGAERRWVYVDAVPILDEAGEVEVVITSTTDITELKRAEQKQAQDAERLNRSAGALRASEHRVRAVIDSAPDPIVVLNPNGNVVDFNPAAETTFQRRRDDVVGKSGSVMVGTRHLEAFERWNSEAREANSHEHAGRRFEATGRRADGTEFPMEVVVTDLPEEERLVAAFVRDLTLRDRLKESSDRLASVVSSAPVIVLACDTQGTVTLAEGSGLASLNLSPDEAVGRNLRHLASWDPEGAALMERVLDGEYADCKLHVAQPDVYLNLASSPIRNGDASLKGISLVLTDVTARVRAWEAERASEAKSRLIAMMNHEVRTPLNSILGFTHLLKDSQSGELNEKQQRYVTNIESSGNHLLDLVNESLDLARLDIGRVQVNLAEVSTSTVIKQAVEQMRPLAEAHGLVLNVTPGVGSLVRADHRQLVQVLLNLLSNAIRHTRPGGSVTVASTRDRDHAFLSVVDTGDGIATEDQARLFEEFFQAKNHAPGGIGLGLAISSRLVRSMGGTIEVASELGEGSKFTVRLRGVWSA